MKKLGIALMIVAVLIIGVGCYGTRTFTRTVDDWGNEMYANNAWLAQPVGWIVIPIAMAFTYIIDGVVDTYHFWAGPAFKGNKGTPFVHKVVK